MSPIAASVANTATDYGALKTLVPLAVPAIKATIDKWLSPAISKMLKERELNKDVKPDNVAKAFEEYLLRTYARLSFMNTIVFGNQQKRIQDLYVPLTVRSTGQNEERFEINDWRDDFVPAFKRVVITDTAGMGKSTILKWLFLCALGTSHGIPVFIELRTLSAQKPILERIYEELCPIDKPFDKDLLLKLITSGSFIFFLDGFDEVPFDDRCAVTEDVQDFIGKAFNNLFILASRHESALGSFGNFREFAIKPLTKNEAYNLLRKYDDTQEHAAALIAELDESKYEQLKDLMVNPMLVSLLFKAYSYKPKVPFKKQIFYRQVFDALFDMHDSTKGGAFVRKKHCDLDIDEFHLVMRDLGFTTAKLGKIEYEKDAICDIIKKVRERNSTVLFQPASLLTDLITTVPLFNKEGEHFKWAHKSVQDYFASQFIALDTKGNEAALLEKIYDGGHCRRFENILDMLHDTDNKSFRRILLVRLFKDYINHYESQYQSSFEGVSQEAIEKRKQLTFGCEVAISMLTKKEFHQFLRSPPKKSGRRLTDIFPKKFRHDSLMFIDINSKIILLAFNTKPPAGLLPLLASKKYQYIIRPKPRFEKGSIEKFPSSGAHIVTDDPKSPLNTPECFEPVNELLAHHGFNISIDQVRRTLKNIEDEANESAHVNQLLQNL
jgi:NACHT domain